MSIEFQYSDEQYLDGYTFQNTKSDVLYITIDPIRMQLDIWDKIWDKYMTYEVLPIRYVEGGELTRLYKSNNEILFELWHLKGVPTELEKILLEYDKETLAPQREQSGDISDVPPFPGGGMGGGMGDDEEKTQLRL